MVNEIKVVGIDPAMANLGIARGAVSIDTMEFKVERLTLVSTENETTKQVRKNSDDIRRARQLYTGMLGAIEDASLAFVEIPVGSQNSRAMASYGMCCMLIAACPIPVIQLTPDEVKLAGAGHKQASKEEMIQWAAAKFPHANWLRHERDGRGKGGKVLYMKGDLQNSNEHLADACGAIQAGLLTDQFRQLMAMYRARSA